MPKRILEYCVEIMREVEKNEKIDYRTDKLPVIYPIVLYTGRNRWLAKMELTQMQDEIVEIKKMVMSSYILVDINNYTTEELIKQRSSVAKAMLIEKIQSEEELINTLEKIVEEPLNLEEKNFVLDLLENTIQDRIGKSKCDQLLEKILGKGGESMVYENARRLFNQWYDKAEKTGFESGMKRGMANGMQQGMKQGMKQGITQVAIQMIKNKMSDKTIKKMTNLTDDELKKIKNGVVLSK